MKIRILGMDYTVKNIRHAAADQKFKAVGVNNQSLGACADRDLKEIYIGTNLHPQEATTALIHEVIHAISWISGLGIRERQVRGLEVGLYAFLKDNGINLSPLEKIATKASGSNKIKH